MNTEENVQEKIENYLDTFGINLTEKWKNGKLEKVFGRQKETAELIKVLSRKKKNNAVLVGEAGTGKTSIINALIEESRNNVAIPLIANKVIYSIETSAIMAGTKFRGEMEERLRFILKEAVSKKDVILFIDEIHTLMDSGSSQGSLNMANIMKPYLSTGELQVIGATTNDEYSKIFEKDSALSRRFHKVSVEEPTIKECQEILFQCSKDYSSFHKVKFSKELLKLVPEYAKKYITGKFLPDSAIDILDEMGAKKKIAKFSEAQRGELEDIIEKKKDLEQKREDFVRENIHMSNENFTETMQGFTSKIESYISEVKEHYSKLDESEVEITTEDMLEVVSSISKIPLDKLNESGTDKIKELEESFKDIVGQEQAVEKVLKTMKKNVLGFNNPKKPIGVFLFLGMTGTGKTYLSEILSEAWYNGKLIRIDMSEFQDKHSGSGMIGTHAGYVGYEEGGQLTNQVRENPYSVVLLDEVEKAHKDVLNNLLQVFDNGYLTDGQGRKVNFRNTIIIMTSNIGASASQENTVGFNGGNSRDLSMTSEKEAKKFFTPEFWNRIDHKVVFNKLDRDSIKQIMEIELNKACVMIEGKGITVTVSENMKEALVDSGYSDKYGARNMKRCIEDDFVDPITEFIFTNDPDKLNIDWVDGEISIS